MLALALIFVIYLIDRSKLLDPKISWEIDGELVTDAQRYEDLIKPLINNKYLINLNQIKRKLQRESTDSMLKLKGFFGIKSKYPSKSMILLCGGDQRAISHQKVFYLNQTLQSDQMRL